MAGPPPASGDSELRREDPLIFVSDASAEAERLTSALRARGYQVVDVPLTLLVGRVAVQRPALILCDVDAEGALETTHRLRDIPGGAGVDIIFIGEAGRTLEDMADAVFHEGSGFFVRPVDVFSLLHKAEALIGPPASASMGSILPAGQRGTVRISSHPPQRRTPSQPPEASDSRPPSSPLSRPGSAPPDRPPSNPPGRIVASASRAPSSPPSKTPSSPPGARAPSSPPQLPTPGGLGRASERELAKVGLARQIPQAEISPELEQLLQRAEQRVGRVSASGPPSFRLDPEAEVDAILPADVLAALDEPLDLDDDEDDSAASAGTRTGSEAGGRTTSGTASTTQGGSTAIGAVPSVVAQRTSSGTQATGVTSGTQPPPPDAVEAALPPGAATASGPEPMEAADAGAPAPRKAADSEPPPTPPAVPTRPPSEPSWPPPSSFAGVLAMPAAAAVAATTQPGRPAYGDEAARAAASAAEGAIRRMTEASGPVAPRMREVPPTEPPPASDELDPSSEPALEIASVLGDGDAFRALARAIRSRYTGALAFEEPAGIRRVVLRDGDFVTAASGSGAESLAAFLAQRGDLSPDAARQARKLPPFGRHAGAALIAHGHLRQDDLWPVLRAHAEWILGKIANMNQGSASVERQAPPRLQAEPAVFGGATGAEVLVEIARRTLGPDLALKRLGGPDAQLTPGSAQGLIGECALPDAELTLVNEARSARLAELLGRAQGPEFASVLYALLELGVLARAPGRRAPEKAAPTYDELDDAALRTRILTRKALVDEGDYFALLGVGRSATAYDIRRAYVTLRREFEPSRVLGASTADLRDEVDVILEVLEEAYEILKDERRRDRYRRALEASPAQPRG